VSKCEMVVVVSSILLSNFVSSWQPKNQRMQLRLIIIIMMNA